MPLAPKREITYEYVKFAAQLTQEEKDLISNRTAGGNVKLNVAPFELVPLFQHVCHSTSRAPSEMA